MIVGTIALLSLLFSGNFSELFFVDDLEKAVKEYVSDKEVQKDILSDLKSSNAFYKDFNKSREEGLKEFSDLNKSLTTSKEEMQSLFSKLIAERIIFQDSVINQRMRIINKISEEEWNLIIAYSKESYRKKIEKLQKKNAKKDAFTYFEKSKKAIRENISDSLSQNVLLQSLDSQVYELESLALEMSAFNVKDSDVLINKNASREDFLSFFNRLNEIRKIGFSQVMQFHFLAVENSSEASFEKIINAYMKDVSITPR